LNLPDVSEYTTTGRQDADIQSKVGELEVLNQSLRNRDKLKDDAISQLSDQPIPSLARRSHCRLVGCIRFLVAI
jgi:hypothetical protein